MLQLRSGLPFNDSGMQSKRSALQSSPLFTIFLGIIWDFRPSPPLCNCLLSFRLEVRARELFFVVNLNNRTESLSHEFINHHSGFTHSRVQPIDLRQCGLSKKLNFSNIARNGSSALGTASVAALSRRTKSILQRNPRTSSSRHGFSVYHSMTT